MSPNCIVLRTFTCSSHVFIKVFQGFPNLVRARDADRAIDGAGRLGARWWACKSSDSYGNPMLTGLQPPFSIWSFWETANFRITKINLQHKKKPIPFFQKYQKKKHPPGCSCLLFFWGCFQHTAKGLLQKSWSEWSKPPLHLRSYRGIAFCQRAAMQNAKTGSTVHPQKTHGKSLEIWGFY